ncbi:DUF5691 domain-containing protein [Thalassoroseus pseudoceratinae]|uniref:DUF5691 domain-containing protein n=1 Tax=Thalassoroseus pseudoceratinae TaxID=2713176 RepID=UPI00141E0804|nr:DUF5691 domain-containing protein [Thalassoroseus pseudoceratinae]
MDDLTKVALAGTSRGRLSSQTLNDGLGAELVSQLESDSEDTLLLQAGVQTVCEQAGRISSREVQPISPAPAESRNCGSRRLAGLLQNAFATNSKELLAEFLRQMQGGGLVLPPDLLPTALDASDANLREQLLPVLGERGVWLSEFRPEWSWVRTGVASLSGRDRDVLQTEWEHGTIRERCQVLRTIRRADPSEGRTWLESTFSQEKAEFRARLLGAFEHGLSANDEEFLEAALDDRSTQVQSVAAYLLSQLTESAFATRMHERAEAMLSKTPDADRECGFQLVCNPPEKIDKAWKRDGIASKPPTGQGKRAYWTQTVLATIPPLHWVTRFDSAPEHLIQATRGGTFDRPILKAWTTAAARFVASDPKSGEWLTPLWNYWADLADLLKGKGREEAFSQLHIILPIMSAMQIEETFVPFLQKTAKNQALEMTGLLGFVPQPWSEKLGRAYLNAVRPILKASSRNSSYQWSNTLFTAAKALPREVFEEALAGWEVAAAESSGWHAKAIVKETERFQDIIRTRQSFYEEVQTTP